MFDMKDKQHDVTCMFTLHQLPTWFTLIHTLTF